MIPDRTSLTATPILQGREKVYRLKGVESDSRHRKPLKNWMWRISNFCIGSVVLDEK